MNNKMDEFAAALENVWKKHEAALHGVNLRVEELEREVTGLLSEVETLKKTCAGKDQEIASLKSKCVEKDKEVESLKDMRDMTSQEMLLLKNKRNETVKSLQTKVIEKNSSIASLRRLVVRLTGQDPAVTLNHSSICLPGDPPFSHVQQSTSEIASEKFEPGNQPSAFPAPTSNEGRPKRDDERFPSSASSNVSPFLRRSGQHQYTVPDALFSTQNVNAEDLVEASTTFLNGSEERIEEDLVSPSSSQDGVNSQQSVEMYSPSLLSSLEKKDISPPIVDETLFSPSLLKHRRSKETCHSLTEVVGCGTRAPPVVGTSGSDTDSLTSPNILLRPRLASSGGVAHDLLSEIPPSDTQFLVDSFETQPPSPEIGHSFNKPWPKRSKDEVGDSKMVTRSDEPLDVSDNSVIFKVSQNIRKANSKAKEMTLRKKFRRKNRKYQITLTQGYLTPMHDKGSGMQEMPHPHNRSSSRSAPVPDGTAKKSPTKSSQIQKSPIKSLLCRPIVTVVPQTPACNISPSLKTIDTSRRASDAFDPEETVLPMDTHSSVSVVQGGQSSLASAKRKNPTIFPQVRSSSFIPGLKLPRGLSSEKHPFCREKNLEEMQECRTVVTTSSSEGECQSSFVPKQAITDEQLRRRLKLPDFPCAKVVRKKCDRKWLLAQQCQECEKWYRDNPERMPETCRHKRTYNRTDTPSDFFDIALPPTQTEEDDPSTHNQ